MRVDDQVQRGIAVHAHQRRVAERVAQRGELPVHHGAHRGRVVSVQDGVVDPVVAVHDRGAALLRNGLGAERNAVARRRRRGGRRAAGPGPTANPIDVPGVPDIRWACRNRRARPRSGRRVQVGEHPDQCVDAAVDDGAGRQALRVRRAVRTTCPATNSTIWNGAPSTESSSHSVIARATGTAVSCSAATTLYSRAMSCADGVSPCSGGRRNTHFDASSSTRKVRLERPPEISCARNSPSRSMPSRTQILVQRGEVEPVKSVSGSHRTCLSPGALAG